MPVTLLEIQAARLDMLSRLAGDLSHEIKNPLHAMVINLELVRRRAEKGESEGAIERVDVVEMELRKVHELAHALIETLRPPRGPTDGADVAAILNELLPIVRARARLSRIGFEYVRPDTGPNVAVPPPDLRHLLLGLFERAVASARGDEEGSVALAARPCDDGIRVDVEFSGAAPSDAEIEWLGGAEGAAPDDDAEAAARVLGALAARAGAAITSVASDAPARPNRLTLTLPLLTAS